jgi:SAM-dependent methyltransferase
VVDARGRVAYFLCRRCGLVFQSPRPTPEELQSFYSGEYRRLKQDTEEPTEKDQAMQVARARATLAFLRPRVRRVVRHLDVGSSSGALLRHVGQEYSCAGVGVEPGEVYRRFSQALGQRIYPSLGDLAAAGEGIFDLVSLMHVLEHLPDPVGTLASLRRNHMSDGGVLILEVPNLIEHVSLERAHLKAFTAGTLRETVRRAGFRVLEAKAHGSFRSPILRLYVTLLAQAQPDSPALAGIRSSSFGIRLLRSLGSRKRRWLTRLLPDWTWQSPHEYSAED